MSRARRSYDHLFSNLKCLVAREIDAIKSGLVSVIRPKNVTDRPAFERQMDPLSEAFGSMRIQEAVYTRLEATAPCVFHYSLDTFPRTSFRLLLPHSRF